MKLRQLTALKNALPGVFDLSPVFSLTRAAEDELLPFTDLTDEFGLSNISNRLMVLDASAREVSDIISRISSTVDQQIQQQAQTLFVETDEYVSQFKYTLERTRELRKVYVPAAVLEYVTQAINTHINWQYPGMQIGCAHDEFTSQLVGCDPLYLVDPHALALRDTSARFPEEYQRRLCPYTITNMDFGALPQNQIGFIFSWSYFNYLTDSQTQQMLGNIFRMLRPGGVAMIGYNNCELPAAAEYAEVKFMTWMPKSRMQELCFQQGFIIASSTDFEPAVSWVEIRKPGELVLTKAHQVMGEIKYATP